MGAVLYLLGVGPGDPDLLTLGGARILSRVDVVAYPRKRGETGSLALQIAGPHLRPGVEELAIDLPMEKDRNPARAAYDAGARRIAVHLRSDRSLAYLCEGDPFFYGSAMYLFSRLAGGHDVRIIPGVSSIGAGAAAVKRPLAARNEIFKTLPATLDDVTLMTELKSADAAAIIKVGRHFGRIRDILEQTGHAGGARLVEFASMPGQKVRPVSDVGNETLPYFSMIICNRSGEPWGDGEKTP